MRVQYKELLAQFITTCCYTRTFIKRTTETNVSRQILPQNSSIFFICNKYTSNSSPDPNELF